MIVGSYFLRNAERKTEYRKIILNIYADKKDNLQEREDSL